VTPQQVKRVGIRKSPDGSYGGWRLQRVRVWVRDQLICDEDGINQWLEDEYLWWASDSCGSSTTIVNKLQVRVTTSDIKNAGTDDTVRFYTGNDVWVLDNHGHDDFERGNVDVFDLDPGTGLYESDLLTVMIYKNPDGSYGGWRLQGLELLVNGSTVYDNQGIDRWLKDDKRVWLDLI
jgi:hypothetical protein